MIILHILRSGSKLWDSSGFSHRLNGPAVIWADGTIEYWLNGKPVTEYEIMFFDPIL